MKKHDEGDSMNDKSCWFCEKILSLIKLEINATWQAITENQLIVFVKSMLLKIKVVSYIYVSKF